MREDGRWSGIELNPQQAAFIRGELGIECVETLDELPDLGPFDVVYHKDVLSHLPDPVATFSQLREALKPGGIMVFETGNGDYDLRYAPLIKSFEFPDHLFFFSEPALGKLLAASGFDFVARFRYGTTVQLRIDRMLRRVLRRHVGSGGPEREPSVAGPAWGALELVPACVALPGRLGLAEAESSLHDDHGRSFRSRVGMSSSRNDVGRFLVLGCGHTGTTLISGILHINGYGSFKVSRLFENTRLNDLNRRLLAGADVSEQEIQEFLAAVERQNTRPLGAQGSAPV